MKDLERRHLAQADRQIPNASAKLPAKRLIRQLAQRGQTTLWAKDMLVALKSSLRTFETQGKLIVSMVLPDSIMDDSAKSRRRG